MNISNYGVKKMLPRLIVAAIVVNISYYLCQIAVDISNIVGTSIYEMLINMKVGTGATADVNSLEDALTLSGTGNWESIVGGLLAGVAGVVLVVAICLAPMVLLSFLVILLILVARQALVIILIVISPLAFVAYILPNTEQLFKRWWKMFVATLVVFPVVGLVFGASALTSKILLEVAAGGNNEGDDKQMLALIAMAVAAIPLFAVPSILRGSLNATGAIGAKIQGYANKQQTQALDSEGMKRWKQRREQNKAFTRAGKYAGLNPLNKLQSRVYRHAVNPLAKSVKDNAGNIPIVGKAIRDSVLVDHLNKRASADQKWEAALTEDKAKDFATQRKNSRGEDISHEENYRNTREQYEKALLEADREKSGRVIDTPEIAAARIAFNGASMAMRRESSPHDAESIVQYYGGDPARQEIQGKKGEDGKEVKGPLGTTTPSSDSTTHTPEYNPGKPPKDKESMSNSGTTGSNTNPRGPAPPSP